MTRHLAPGPFRRVGALLARMFGVAALIAVALAMAGCGGGGG